MVDLLHSVRSTTALRVLDGLLAVRALLFVGRRFTCPCCGWRLRAFTHGGSSLRVRRCGYCPRCNSKARHRRDWLYLLEQTDLSTANLRLLHISPKYSLARRLTRMPNLDYLAGDLSQRAHISLRFDVASLPVSSETFDAVICIHVLEHVDQDRRAMSEIFRVLRPGGWALITAPVRLDQPTHEDPSITEPEERRRAFGETDHVRFYGYDLVDRLEESGFTVRLDRAEGLDEDTKSTYGLLDDENVFFCQKPLPHPDA